MAASAVAALQTAPLPAAAHALSATPVDGPSAGSSRELPYNHALRRGHRAPEAVAAALAKRAFVRAVPFLVAEGTCGLAVLHRWPTAPPLMHAIMALPLCVGEARACCSKHHTLLIVTVSSSRPESIAGHAAASVGLGWQAAGRQPLAGWLCTSQPHDTRKMMSSALVAEISSDEADGNELLGSSALAVTCTIHFCCSTGDAPCQATRIRLHVCHCSHWH